MLSWIRHQSRSAHLAAKRKSLMFLYSHSNLFNTQTLNGKTLTHTNLNKTTIRTRQRDGEEQKMFQCYFGGWGDLSLWMWLRVWAFLFFPPWALKWQLRQDGVSFLLPSVSTLVGKWQSKMWAFWFEPHQLCFSTVISLAILFIVYTVWSQFFALCVTVQYILKLLFHFQFLLFASGFFITGQGSLTGPISAFRHYFYSTNQSGWR